MIDVFAAKPDKDAENGADDGDKPALWRKPFDSPAWPKGGDGRLDASPGMLHRLKTDPELTTLLEKATTEEPARPALTSPLLEAWSMTSLAEHPGRPEVEPWLRGWVDSNEFFRSAPPHRGEILEALTSEVVDTVQRRSKALQGQLFAILAGRTVVLDAELGGLDDAGLLESKAETPPPTLDSEDDAWRADFLVVAGFRVRPDRADAQQDADWRVECRWRIVADDGGEWGPAPVRIGGRQAEAAQGRNAGASAAAGGHGAGPGGARATRRVDSPLHRPWTKRRPGPLRRARAPVLPRR